MKLFLKLLLFIGLIVSCSTKKKTLETSSSIKGVLRYDTGELKAEGYFDKKNYELDTKLPEGKWSFYYKSGKIKSTGEYKIGYYTNCCTGGVCEMPYSYKVGEWKYYYANNKLKAKGNLSLSKKKIKTSCEGGDEINFGRVNKNWIFYDFYGNNIKPTTKQIEEIEKTSIIDYWDTIK